MMKNKKSLRSGVSVLIVQRVKTFISKRRRDFAFFGARPCPDFHRHFYLSDHS